MYPYLTLTQLNESLVCSKSLVKMENDGTLMMKATMRFAWTDDLRRWDAKKIPVEVISVPARELWFPSFFLENCEKFDCFVEPKRDRKIEVRSSGNTRLVMSPLIEVRSS